MYLEVRPYNESKSKLVHISIECNQKNKVTVWKNNIRTLTFSLLASEIYTYFIDPMKLKQRKTANYLADKKISSNFAPLKWHSAV